MWPERATRNWKERLRFSSMDSESNPCPEMWTKSFASWTIGFAPRNEKPAPGHRGPFILRNDRRALPFDQAWLARPMHDYQRVRRGFIQPVRGNSRPAHFVDRSGVLPH